MSGYALAVQQGAQAAAVAFGGESPATIAAFNARYNARMQKFQLREKRVAAERNIAAIQKDKILTNSTIQLKQNAAEAALRANAAWVGAEGGSVEATVYETRASAQRQIAAASKRANQETKGQLAAVGSASLSLSAVQEPQQASLLGTLLSAFSQFDTDDLSNLGDIIRGDKKDGST